MRRFLLLTTAAFATCVSTNSLAEDQQNTNAQQKLQGRWEIVRGVNQGRALSEAEISGTYVTVTTNSIVTYDRDKQARYQAVFTLDEEKKPVQITMMAVAKDAPTRPQVGDKLDGKNASSLGILKFDGKSKWTLCYALPGADRPEKFESPQGSKVMLFTLEKKQGDPVTGVRD